MRFQQALWPEPHQIEASALPNAQQRFSVSWLGYPSRNSCESLRLLVLIRKSSQRPSPAGFFMLPSGGFSLPAQREQHLMTAAVHNITIDTGASRPDIVWRIPVDSTGSTWALFLKPPTGPVVEIEGGGDSLAVEIKARCAGRTDITWRRDAAASLNLPIYYELWQTEPDGGTRPWVRGTIDGVGRGLGASP